MKKLMTAAALTVLVSIPAVGGESSGAATPVFPTTIAVTVPAGDVAKAQMLFAKEVEAGRLSEFRKSALTIAGRTSISLCARFGVTSEFRYTPGTFFRFKNELLASLSADARISQPHSCDATLPVGTWGGRGVGIEVTDKGVKFEYDCSHGRIDGPVSLDGTGHFDVLGVHVREHGGPIHPDEQPDTHPARYTGQVDPVSKTLRYSITLTDSGTKLGGFEAKLGKQPMIMKCL